MNNQQFRLVHHFEILALYLNVPNEMYRTKKVCKTVSFYCYMAEKIKASTRIITFSSVKNIF